MAREMEQKCQRPTFSTKFSSVAEQMFNSVQIQFSSVQFRTIGRPEHVFSFSSVHLATCKISIAQATSSDGANIDRTSAPDRQILWNSKENQGHSHGIFPDQKYVQNRKIKMQNMHVT
jgi:hypothetical protein